MLRNRLRCFSTAVVVAFIVCLFGSLSVSSADVPLDPNQVVLLSDPHLNNIQYLTHQREGFERTINDVLARNPRPATALIMGDIALGNGDIRDYRKFKEMIKPLEKAGIKWYACFGNHDRRTTFFQTFPELKEKNPLVPNRFVTIVKTPHVDFILLDSCLEGPVEGGLDDAQFQWLAKTLKTYPKPVYVCAHHPLKQTKVDKLITGSKNAIGYIHGHSHMWRHRNFDNVDTICLPSTGHWGDIGYVILTLKPNQATFKIYQRDYFERTPPKKTDPVNPLWKKRQNQNDGDSCHHTLQQAA